LIPAEDFYLLDRAGRRSEAIGAASTIDSHPNKLHCNSDSTVTLGGQLESAFPMVCRPAGFLPGPQAVECRQALAQELVTKNFRDRLAHCRSALEVKGGGANAVTGRGGH
jgi:hypothetical protein